jgi:hypothetical protein
MTNNNFIKSVVQQAQKDLQVQQEGLCKRDRRWKDS